MKKFIFPLLLSAIFVPCLNAGTSPRTRELFDFDWKFFRGEAQGAEQTGFKDTGWQAVNLPHDWSIERVPGAESLFNKKLNQGSGCLPGGIGWYRKSFTLPAEAKGKRVFIEFEGVYMGSEVWLNGEKLGTHPYGYTSFEYELTDHLKYGEPNIFAVRSKVDQPCSRWFSGAGIYRHVWLTVTNPVHVAHWGTYVTTPEIGKDSAKVRVRTQIKNQGEAATDVTLRTILLDPAGNKIATGGTTRKINAGEQTEADETIEVKSPALWSLEKPQLYTARTELLVDGKLKDSYLTPFGIRTIEFTMENGFLLNGKRVQLKGVCNHHDQGCLGAAAYDRAIERQIEILKSMGCNAIRTSHNPPAPKLLELCDRMGILVMDEAFDEWKNPKTKLGYGRFFDEWSEPDLVGMLHRDRNHPSVILWSIGNEISEQGDANGGEMAKRLADICHREDPARPVTAACHNPGGAAKTGFADALDLFGINYQPGAYNTFHGKYKLVASESSSDVSSRGEYNLVEKDGALTIESKLNNQVTSYDIFRPGWAVQAEQQLKAVADAPWVAGEFVWTGFDYIGEPTPFPWPAVSSYFGILDLCGFPKDRYYLYQSRWMDKPMVHILPHWNWPQFAGKNIPVWCYSNADTVELFLNGKSLGEKRMADGAMQKFIIDEQKEKDGTLKPVVQETGWYHVAWEVPWQPGTLKAVAKRGGKIIASDEVSTADKPAKLALSVDRRKINADGEDLSFVTVKVLDEKGRICPDANNLVKFKLSGPGKIAGVGNGDATCHEDFQASQRSASHGLCMAVLQSSRNKPGTLRLSASAEGLKSAETEIQAALKE
ncbi:MAG: glycoside hydrolase family 2 TIM barrel-domain containing protein [Verrucomicrobiota bacterium]